MIMLKIQPNGICKKIDINGDIESLQKEIGCQTITLANIFPEFDNMGIDIFADDEGLLVDDPQISIVLLGKNGGIVSCIAGTVLICGHTEGGDIVGLTTDQLLFVVNNMSGVLVQKSDGTRNGVITFIFDEQINEAIRGGDKKR